MKIFLLILTSLSLAAQTGSDAPQFRADGQLNLPKDYREWVFLSSGLGMRYDPAANQDNPTFENVYVNPSSYRAFVASGEWPDKTMFILEFRQSADHGSIVKGGRYQTAFAGIEGEVKDGTRFPAKWAFFDFGKADKATALPANSSCNACHKANGAVDNTFVQFYPTLLEVATRKGTLKAGENHE